MFFFVNNLNINLNYFLSRGWMQINFGDDGWPVPEYQFNKFRSCLSHLAESQTGLPIYVRNDVRSNLGEVTTEWAKSKEVIYIESADKCSRC